MRLGVVEELGGFFVSVFGSVSLPLSAVRVLFFSFLVSSLVGEELKGTK